MTRFADAVLVDPAAAEAGLLADLAAAGGPLVEEIPGSDEVLVTFVAAHNGQAVCLRSPLASLVPGLAPESDISLERVTGTDVWHTSIAVDRRVSTTYQYRLQGEPHETDLETEYSLLAEPVGLHAFAGQMLRRGFADPANPDRMFPVYGVLGDSTPEKTEPRLWESVLTLPGAEPFSHLSTARRRGTVTEHRFQTKAIPETRTVTVYLPPDYDPHKRYPLAVVLDGEYYLMIGRFPEILDHAIDCGKIPPVIVVFWHNLDSSSRMQELTCSPGLASALIDELWPWVDARFSVSSQPRDRIITGFSLGGLASAWIGLEHPDVFGSVLAVSPSLWFAPDDGEAVAEPGWLIREYSDRGSVRLRLYLAVGSLETSPLDRVGSPLSMVDFARSFRNVVGSKRGVELGYCEEPAGHDYVNVRRSTMKGLAALLGDIEPVLDA